MSGSGRGGSSLLGGVLVDAHGRHQDDGTELAAGPVPPQGELADGLAGHAEEIGRLVECDPSVGREALYRFHAQEYTGLH